MSPLVAQKTGSPFTPVVRSSSVSASVMGSVGGSLILHVPSVVGVITVVLRSLSSIEAASLRGFLPHLVFSRVADSEDVQLLMFSSSASVSSPQFLELSCGLYC